MTQEPKFTAADLFRAAYVPLVREALDDQTEKLRALGWLQDTPKASRRFRRVRRLRIRLRLALWAARAEWRETA